MLYKIVNPSDRYTIDCPDLEIATAACLLLGYGSYAFEPIDPTHDEVPLMIFGEDTAWMAAHHHGLSVVDLLSKVRRRRAKALADALDSVIIGDRRLYLDTVKLLPDDEAKATFKAEWHDRHRSSMNDIGGRAWALAAAIRRDIEASRRSETPERPGPEAD